MTQKFMANFEDTGENESVESPQRASPKKLSSRKNSIQKKRSKID